MRQRIKPRQLRKFCRCLIVIWMTNTSGESAIDTSSDDQDKILPKIPDDWRNLESGLKTDLVFAYRKAKADVFQTGYLSRFAVANYEEQIWDKLQKITEQISEVASRPWTDFFEEQISDDRRRATIRYAQDDGLSPSWCSEIVGDLHYIFKKADWREDKNDPRIHHFSSQHLRAERVQRSTHSGGSEASQTGKSDAEERKLVLRPICVGTMDLHVLSALWIARVGSKFDAELSDSVYSNRVRRSYDKKHVNNFALGSLEPYLNNYRRWKEDGVNAVEELVKANKDALFISADLTSYFHNIDPNFLLHEGWLTQWQDHLFDEKGEKALVGEGLAIHILLVEAFKAWSQKLGKALGKANAVGGLPVGVSASNVIGNIALIDLDRAVEQGIKPRFYGRYVDDIAMVIEGHPEIEDLENLGEWIKHRLTLFPLGKKDSPDKDVELCFCASATTSSEDSTQRGRADSDAPSDDGPAHAKAAEEADRQHEPKGQVVDTGSSIIEIRVPFQKNSKFVFNEDKFSLVHAEGKFGQWAVNHVRSVMTQNTSEWRNMPVLPEDPVEVATKIIALMYEQPTKDAEFFGLEAIATKRAGFALKVRDLKTIARNVTARDWAPHREQFITSFLQHTSRPNRFTEFHNYYQRLFRLCLEVGDTGSAQRIAHALEEAMRSIAENRTTLEVAGQKVDADAESVLTAWRKLTHERFAEEVVSVPERLASAGHKRALLKTLQSLEGQGTEKKKTQSAEGFGNWFPKDGADEESQKEFYREAFQKLFSMDLALVPFKQVLVSRELDHYAKGNPVRFENCDFAFLQAAETQKDEVPSALERLLGESTWKLLEFLDVVGARFSVEKLIKRLEDHSVDEPVTIRGIIFPTRPPSPIELFAWTRVAGADGRGPWSDCDVNMRHVQDWFLIARGFAERTDIFADLPVKDVDRFDRLKETMQKELKQPAGIPWRGSNNETIWFPSVDADQSKVNVAIGALLTPQQYLTQSVMGNPQIGLKRWNRTAKLVNSVMSEGSADYFVLHEACLPPTWFLTAATHLRRKSINLISGVEYLHGPPPVVHNQVWFSAIHKGFRFPSLGLYIQDKQRPAHVEADNLNHIDQLKLEPKVAWQNKSKPPRIAHGNFHFALLVCSELTNSEYRNSLRGAIDALFVVEWNKDLNTFNSLVEASALDIHSYIVQVNNREYGDSRIRVPARESHKRDMVQIRGGTNDHFVVGELDIKGLREFQSHSYIPKGEFKPLPDGFELKHHRKK